MAVPKRKKSKSVTKMGQANKSVKLSSLSHIHFEDHKPTFMHVARRCK